MINLYTSLQLKEAEVAAILLSRVESCSIEGPQPRVFYEKMANRAKRADGWKLQTIQRMYLDGDDGDGDDSDY